MNLCSVGQSRMSDSYGLNSQPRLIQAAHEFEGQMLKELLKPLATGDSLTGASSGEGGNDDGANGSGGILGEFAAEALGKALSEHGGFGIADRILGQLSRSGNHSGMAGVTGETHFDTDTRALK